MAFVERQVVKMKKILPINANPYIRTYTHHGYHHAVISTHDKVPLGENDPVASIYVNNFYQNSWNSRIEGLSYDIVNNAGLTFYANKWNLNMNAAFWRVCDVDDNIEIIINDQLYSNVWASVYVFLSKDDKETITDFDQAYNFVFGNFAKDGVYYKDCYCYHTTLGYLPVFPISLRLEKNQENVILAYTDFSQSKNTLTIPINETKSPNEIIGFGVNLRCNTYFEWLFSNYINTYVDLNNSISIDYLCDIHKDWNCHTYNHFLDFSVETENEINRLGYQTIDYIKLMLNCNKYVETMINEGIYMKKKGHVYYHQNLIYGYDDESMNLYMLFYNKGKVTPITMSYEDFLSDENKMKNRKLYIYKYNPAYEYYRMQPLHIAQIFEEYRDSINITYYEAYYGENVRFGISGLKSFLSDIGKEKLMTDTRVSYLLNERSKCNYDRVEYLYQKQLISGDDYKVALQLSKQICNITLLIRNLILKRIYGGKYNDEAIEKYFSDYITLEIDFTDAIICGLKKNTDEN